MSGLLEDLLAFSTSLRALSFGLLSVALTAVGAVFITLFLFLVVECLEGFPALVILLLARGEHSKNAGRTVRDHLIRPLFVFRDFSHQFLILLNFLHALLRDLLESAVEVKCVLAFECLGNSGTTGVLLDLFTIMVELGHAGNVLRVARRMTIFVGMVATVAFTVLLLVLMVLFIEVLPASIVTIFAWRELSESAGFTVVIGVALAFGVLYSAGFRRSIVSALPVAGFATVYISDGLAFFVDCDFT